MLASVSPTSRLSTDVVEMPKGVHDCFYLPFFDATPGAAALGLDGIAAFVLAQCE